MEMQVKRPTVTLVAALVVVVAVATLALAPPPSSAALAPDGYVTMFSEPGDWVGGGVNQTFDPTDSTIYAFANDPNTIDVTANGGTDDNQFAFRFHTPAAVPLVAGRYERAKGLASPDSPQLQIGGEGRGCNDSIGSFEILDLERTGTTLTRLHVRYELRCGLTMGPALFGEVRVGVPETGAVVTSGSIAWPLVDIGQASATVPVSVRNPLTTAFTIDAVSIEGPSAPEFSVESDTCSRIVLAPGGSCSIEVGFRPVVPGGRTAHLSIPVAGWDATVQLDGSRRMGTTRFQAQGDDWVGQGRSWDYTTGIVMWGSPDHVGGQIRLGGEYWSFDFSPADGDVLESGRTYLGATRWPFRGNGVGMEVTGNSRGCNQIDGSFTVDQAVFDPVDESITRLDLTFEQSCDHQVPMTGRIRLDAADLVTPPPVTDLVAAVHGGSIDVSWVNPVDARYAQTVVRIDPVAAGPVTTTSGSGLYAGTGTTTSLSTRSFGGPFRISALTVDVDGNVSAPQQVTGSTSTTYTALAPIRALDTRTADVPSGWPAGTPVGPGQTLVLPVAGTHGVPAEARAVVLNLTGADPSADTFVTAHPTGSPPATSNLNIAAGGTRASLVTVLLGDDGSVSLTNAAGHINLIADLAGFYSDEGTGRFTPLAPVRRLDTRTANVPAGWSPGEPVGPGQTLDLPVAGIDGVPADATAVVINLTTSDPTSGTYISAYPTGTPPPAASNLNVQGGEVGANLAVVRLGTGGRITLRNHLGSTNLVIDVLGAYGPSGTTSFVPTTPVRVIDTRTTNVPTGRAAGAALTAGTPLSLPIAGTAVPPSARAAVLTLTATDVTAPSFVTAFPSGTPLPNASNLNVVPGDTRANLTTTGLGRSGRIDVATNNGAQALIADLSGYFLTTG